MLDITARGCPPGPFPGWCDPSNPAWSSCRPVPDAASAALAHPGACYEQDFGLLNPPSWWTPLHVTGVALAVLGAGILIGALIAVIRDRVRNRRFDPQGGA